MRSKASIKGHPVHPILIVFPAAFLFGAFGFDILSLFFHREHFVMIAFYLSVAGIVGGLLAAIPGIIDYIYTIPPDSSAKIRGTKHALVNVIALTLFGIGIYLRLSENGLYPLLIILLEAAGITFLSLGGYMGGTLVYRNQIGVDIRYANAGKWKEESVHGELTPGSATLIGHDTELTLNQMKLIHVSGKRIVLCYTENGYTAFDDRCTHRGGSLASGAMISGTVQCPWHGTQFNVRNGYTKCGPGKAPVATYKVEVISGKIFLI